MTEHDPYAELQGRTADNYERREGENLFVGFFDPDAMAGIPTWYAEKGEHVVNILPYVAGPNDPKVGEGHTTYILDIYVHHNIGPRDLQFVCLESNYHKPCPVCEERNRMRKNPPFDYPGIVLTGGTWGVPWG